MMDLLGFIISHWSRAGIGVFYISAVPPAIPVVISVFQNWFSPRRWKMLSPGPDWPKRRETRGLIEIIQFYFAPKPSLPYPHLWACESQHQVVCFSCCYWMISELSETSRNYVWSFSDIEERLAGTDQSVWSSHWTIWDLWDDCCSSQLPVVAPGDTVVLASLLSSTRSDGKTSLEIDLLCGHPCTERWECERWDHHLFSLARYKVGLHKTQNTSPTVTTSNNCYCYFLMAPLATYFCQDWYYQAKAK